MDLHLQLGNAHGAQQLALVLVQTLDLHVHDRVGVEREAVVAAGKGGKAALVLVLDGEDLFAHGAVVLIGHQLFKSLGLEQIVVAAQELADKAVQTGVDLRKPAAVVDAVGDIGEAVGIDGVEIAEQIALEDVAVQTRHAVDAVAGAQAQIGHMDLAVVDDHVAADALVAVELCAQILDPAAVDLAEDLPHARQLRLDQILRPALKRLAHDGVVGVGDSALDDLPALVPAQAVLVHENAHQLGDDHGRVRVVDLDRVVVGEGADVAPGLHVLAHDVLRGGGQEEILLAQTQGLALDVVVGGIEHLGDDLGHRALFHRLDVFALGEAVHIERVGAVGLPQAQRVDGLAGVADDQHVAGDGEHRGIAGVLGVIVAVAVPHRRDLAAEADLDHVVIARHQPALHRGTPVVGNLGLLAVDKALLENAELVAQRIAGGAHAQRGHGIHIAGGQTAETAVAETRVGLFLKDIAGVAAHVLQSAGQRLGQAEVVGVLHQAAAHQKLHGHIVNRLRAARGIFGDLQTTHELAQNNGRGLENLSVGGVLSGNAKVGTELILNGTADLFTRNLTFHRFPPKKVWRISCLFHPCRKDSTRYARLAGPKTGPVSPVYLGVVSG